MTSYFYCCLFSTPQRWSLLCHQMCAKSKFLFVLQQWNGRSVPPLIGKRETRLQLKISCMLKLQQQCKSTGSRQSCWTGCALDIRETICGCFLRRVAWQQAWARGVKRETFWILSIWMPSQQISHTELHCGEPELASTDSFRPHSNSPRTDNIAEYWVPTGHLHSRYRD